MIAPQPAGLAFLADEDGVLRAVLRDGVGFGSRLALGMSFGSVLEPASRDKWDHFLVSVARDKATFNWQMDVAEPDSDKISTLEFAGAEVDGGLLVVATVASDDESARMYEELLAISNDQSTALRAALKRLALMRRAPNVAPAAELWEEQTRINNELVNLQRTLTRRNHELKRLNEEKNQLLGFAAHDLRNPINSVLLACDVLLLSSLDDRQRRTLSRVRAMCGFMAQMVDDMLDLSALEAGRLVLERRDVELAALVESNVAVNRDLAAVKRIAIDFLDEAPGLAPVSLDARRFEQVLNNMISNAVKYSHPGTRVRVTIGLDDTSVVLRVRDEGQGIAAQELGGIFQPFERSSTRATSNEKSTGLGLAIVDRIVRAHQGRITVDSAVGVGTTFAVHLPLPARAS